MGHFHSNFFISAKWTFYHLRLNLWLYLHLQCNYNELEYKNYSWACLFFVPKKVLSPSPVWDTLCTLYEIIYATLSLSSSIHHIPPNFWIFWISVKRWHLVWTRQCGRDSSSLWNHRIAVKVAVGKFVRLFCRRFGQQFRAGTCSYIGMWKLHKITKNLRSERALQANQNNPEYRGHPSDIEISQV